MKRQRAKGLQGAGRRTHRRRWGARTVGAAALLFLLTTAAWGTDTVYLRTYRDEVRPLSLGRVRGWSELSFRGTRDRADRFHLRETILSPRLHLATTGSVYHEKFLSFDLAASLSLEQRRSWGGAEGSDLLSFNDYDAGLLFFKERPLMFKLFGCKNNAWVASPFRTSYRVTSTIQGAEMKARDVPFPTIFSYYHLRRKEDFSTYYRLEEQDQFRMSARHRMDIASTSVSFRFLDYRRNLQFQDYRTVGASFSNTLHFVPKSPSSLNTSARYFHQYGTIGRRDFSLFENLFLQLPWHLEASTRYQFTEQGTRAADAGAGALLLSRAHRGQIDLSHTLYGSVITRVSVYGNFEKLLSSPGADQIRLGEDEQKGGKAALDYRRKTPWGRLFMGYGYEYVREDRSSQQRSRHVANEEHVLYSGPGVRLENPNVDVTSIVVTDESGFTVYEEGVDYVVDSLGVYTLIVRLPGSSIGDGERILVDYTYRYSPKLSYATRGNFFHIRFDTRERASLYYRYNRLKDDFISGIPDGFLEDHRRHLAGLRLRLAGVSVSEEYEVNDYSAYDFSSSRLTADYSWRFSPVTRLHLNGSYSYTRYHQTDRIFRAYMVTSRLATRLPGAIQAQFEGWLRLDRGTPGGPTVDSEYGGGRLQLSRDINAFRVELGAFYRLAEDNEVRDERTDVHIVLKRFF